MKRSLMFVSAVLFGIIGSTAAFSQVNGFSPTGLELFNQSFDVAADVAYDPITDLHDYAGLAIHAVVNETRGCHLYYVDPNGPGLPWQTRPADKAIVNRSNLLLAYYDARVIPHGDYYVFENPNGTYPHDILVSSNEIRFRTPYDGVVARAIRQKVEEETTTFYKCGEVDVDEAGFRGCISHYWSHLISSQLCRYGS